MDEPLSNLDAKLRVQMRGEIAGLQRSLGITTIYVTHDQVEALTMGDRIAVMRGGLLQQVADPDTLYNAPANLFVAAFIGAPAMNLLEGQISINGPASVRIADQQLALDKAEMPRADAAGPVVLGVRPEDLRIADGPEGPRKVTGTVRRRESVGSDLLVTIAIEGAPPLSSEVGALAHVIEGPG
jgi:multiple sugar transport system ATP-binding protein